MNKIAWFHEDNLNFEVKVLELELLNRRLSDDTVMLKVVSGRE